MTQKKAKIEILETLASSVYLACRAGMDIAETMDNDKAREYFKVAKDYFIIALEELKVQTENS
ncbi:MAG TPA: hypothetical protein VN703_08375 [Candidatus Sulfopaludibacter sp.]|nr:hypothetical protein [Candidatus Sulfopaludibacter sp.]